MATYSKYNIIYRLQKWMDSVPGQTFLNYAYSWGASIVILGTLFKLTHLPGANLMLFIGMGTEVFVFFISAFDRPFDKTDDGKQIPTRVTEEYLETGKVKYEGKYEETDEEQEETPASQQSAFVEHEETPRTEIPQPVSQPVQQPTASADAQQVARDEAKATAEEVARQVVPTADEIAAAVKQQSEVIKSSQTSTPEMVEAQEKYVEALQNLTDLLGKVSDQSERLTRDSEEMENLNRTLTGIAKIYEMQLKGASQQVGTIDQINAQTRKMAEQIDQLNRIYARMIEAMTVNMRGGVGAVPPQPQYQQGYGPQYQPGYAPQQPGYAPNQGYAQQQQPQQQPQQPQNGAQQPQQPQK